MKLILKNFRCYEEKEIDFGNEGLVLLSGKSGIGKSSFLFAIEYALYGKGKKVIMTGKKSCHVFMYHNNIEIRRYSRPNRLVVIKEGEEYEDESGQAMIYKIFGTQFDTVSYVKQNAINSFIAMSPKEKLEFLETLAFESINLTQIKIRCSSKEKQIKSDLDKTTGELEGLSSHFQTKEKPKKISFPKHDEKNNNEYKNKIYNDCEKAKTKINKINTEIEQLKTTIHELEMRDNSLSLYNEQEQTLLNRLKNISKVDYEGDEKLSLYKESLESIKNQKEFIETEKHYKNSLTEFERISKEENDKSNKELDEINTFLKENKNTDEDLNILLELETDLQEIQKLEKIIINKSDITNMLISKKQEYKKTNEDLERQQRLLERAKLEKNTLPCPECKTFLLVKKDDKKDEINLIKQEHPPSGIQNKIDMYTKEIPLLKEKIKNLNSDILKLSNSLTNIEEAEKSILTIKNSYEELIPLEKVKEQIKTLRETKNSIVEKQNRKKILQIPSQTLKSFSNNLNKQKEKVDILKSKSKKIKIDLSEGELYNKIITEEKNRELLFQNEKNKKEIEKELAKIKSNIDNLFKNKLNIDDIIRDKKEKENLLDRLQALYSKKLKIKEKIDNFFIYEKEYKEYIELEAKISDLTKREEKLKLELSAIGNLKEILRESESICVQNIIESINAHAQEYLNVFFNDPISVRLESFKETKKGIKSQINIELEYKNIESDITMLSGGELSRVNLAYTLALSEIFNSPIILLDECTSSLDQELTSIVFEGIKNSFSHKLIIVVAHQVVSGEFDRSIELK